MENNPPPQQQQQQPKTSAEMIETVMKDLHVFIEANEKEETTDTYRKESAKLIASSFEKLAEPAPDGPAVKTMFYSDGHGPPSEYLDKIETDIDSLLKSSLHQRLSLAHLINTFVSEFLQKGDLTLEEDDTGYVASNIVLFTQTVDRILQLHQQQLDDLKSTYKVILSNASYPPALQGKISTRASLYLFRYHTACAGCKKDGKTNSDARPCAKSPIHGAPLCQQCLDIEKDSLFFKAE